MRRRQTWVTAAQRFLAAPLALLLSLGASPKSRKPPEFFVDSGACPGECCAYGVWRAEQATDLHEAPLDGSRIVGRVEAGAEATAQTGAVHTKAGRFVVRREIQSYKPGDVIWVYTYLGEGYYKVWRTGDMVTQEISILPNQAHPDDWGYFERAPESIWWVRLRKANGLEGWTNAPGRFSGTHSCG